MKHHSPHHKKAEHHMKKSAHHMEQAHHYMEKAKAHEPKETHIGKLKRKAGNKK